MKSWPDAKRFLFEGIILSILLILGALSCDWLYNLMVATGINRGELHPYSFGLFQDLAFFFGVIQLVRYLNFWRYWE